MPSVSQMLSDVLRLMTSDRQWCLKGIRIILVDRLFRANIKPISDIASLPKVYPLFMGRGAR
jgi:hypothetical protein